MIDEGLQCAGTGLAMQRFMNNRGHVDWKQHSIYMKVQICRAFHRDNQRPCALYAAQFGCILLVAVNLNAMKSHVKEMRK